MLVNTRHPSCRQTPGLLARPTVPCRAAKRRNSSTAQVGALPGLSQLFGASGRNRERQKRAKYTTTATELLGLLTSSSSSSSSSTSDKQVVNRVSELVDVLLSCKEVPFQEQLLAGGPWLVLYTKGSLQLWKSTYNAGKLVNAANAASQDLDPVDRTVVNKAEYYGSQLYVAASGTYEPLDDSPMLPKPIQANIASGLLHIFGLNIPLPIKGSGQFDVVYLDDKLRVFRSGGAVSVQVKQQYMRSIGLA